jgi:hypothetical protein
MRHHLIPVTMPIIKQSKKGGWFWGGCGRRGILYTLVKM